MNTNEHKSQYELFHEWLNNCPVTITHYDDSLDNVEIHFRAPDEEEKWNLSDELASTSLQ
mgnify:CR=1 FL=1